MDKYLKETIKKISTGSDGYGGKAVWVLTANGVFASKFAMNEVEADEEFSVEGQPNNEEVIILKKARFFTSGSSQEVEMAIIPSKGILAWGIGSFIF